VSPKAADPNHEACESMRRLCLSFNLRRTERVVTRHYDAYLAPAGLTAVQFPILAVIATLEEPTFRSLAEDLELDRSTLSRNLGVLERDGLVNVGLSAGRRAGRLSLTRKGQLALRKGYRCWLDAHEALGKLVPESDVARGLQFLKTLRRQAGAAEKGA
jgi:DNA-binding MarR family transcriptional regulator